jgi:hypothetical protein
MKAKSIHPRPIMSAMPLKHIRNGNAKFLKLPPFWLEKLKMLYAQLQLNLIKISFNCIQNPINLTNKEISSIFTKVSNNIAVTITDDTRTEDRGNNTFQHIKNLLISV